MKLLTLGDLKGKSDAQVRAHIVDSWKVHPSELVGIDLLVAYESVGAYGCDSSGFFVFRKRRRLYEVHGSHCSCYGFEDQWRPEETSLAYFRSESFSFSTGGYDGEGSANVDAVKKFFAKPIKRQPESDRSGRVYMYILETISQHIDTRKHDEGQIKSLASALLKLFNQETRLRRILAAPMYARK